MITSKQIRQSVGGLIKNALPVRVFFDEVFDAGEDYAWVNVTSSRADEGERFVRRVQIDIQVVFAPKTGEVSHERLLDAADELDRAFAGWVAVAERAITILHTRARIFDKILHYETELRFADSIERVEVFDFMEELKTEWW